MARFDFCGPTYQGQSPNVDAERCINLYPETVESVAGKSKMALYPSPGLATFANIGATSVLGIFSCRPNGSITDRLFAIGQSGPNQTLFEIAGSGVITNRGMLTAPTTFPVTMQHNGTQLAICSGGQIFIFTFATNVLTLPTSAPTNVAMIDYCDGFFIALIQNSNKFQVSALLDGTTWPALSVAQVSEFPDNVVSMIVNQRGIYFGGVKATVPYYNVGALNVPFVPVSGVYIEGGVGAAFARSKLDNSVFWLDADERGNGIARRAQGYIPERISNHSVETIWSTYSRIDNAISYAFSEHGHTFWHVYFPSGISPDSQNTGASWRYDVATGMWHEVAFWNAGSGRFEAHHSQNYAFAFGKHFVGDWSTGNIYQMASPVASGTAWAFADDAGNQIRRIRRAPHISIENQWMQHHELVIDLETGLGPQPPLVGPSTYPGSYILADSGGNLWQLTMADNGTPRTAPQGTTGMATPIFLNDTSLGNTSWQLGVDLTGHLQVTGVSFSSAYSQALNIATVSGFSGGISVVGGVINGISGLSLPPRGPQLSLRWSNDHAHTWSNYYTVDCGQAGAFTTRARFSRLGRSRTRTYEVSCSDPVPWRFIDAYLKATPGYQPTERLTRNLAKMA